MHRQPVLYQPRRRRRRRRLPGWALATAFVVGAVLLAWLHVVVLAGA